MSAESVPRLSFTRAAKMDTKNAADWYETHSPQLGDRFLAAVDQVTNRLLVFPESSPQVHEEIRRALVPGFPYSLFYIYEEARIRVLAVTHWRR